MRGIKLLLSIVNQAQFILIPFEFNVTQSYILEFGNLYIRFYKDNGQIVEASKTITAITKANPAVVTATSHGYTNGDHVWINNVVGMTEVNSRRSWSRRNRLIRNE